MWSLGNESGTGANLAAMAGLGRGERDPSRPLHYEGDWACARRRRLQPHVRRRTPRSTRSAAATRSRCPTPRCDARRRAHAVHPLRVRARDGQRARAGWPSTSARSSATRAARAASSGSGSTTGIRRRRARLSSPTAATSARRCTTATSSATGCVFPDRTPSPGLLEFKKVIEPVRIAGDGGAACGSRTGTTSATCRTCAFEWSLEDGAGRRRRRRARRARCRRRRDRRGRAAASLPCRRRGESLADGAGRARRRRAVGAGRSRGRVGPAASCAGAGRRVPGPRQAGAARRRRFALGAGCFDARTGVAAAARRPRGRRAAARRVARADRQRRRHARPGQLERPGARSGCTGCATAWSTVEPRRRTS